jgi:D-serine deaminase-like pyridoxal phosphate-dependent protein
VRIIPNHACTTTNLHARLYLVDGEEIVRVITLRARNRHRAR